MPRTKVKSFTLELDRLTALEIERLAKEGERTPEQQIRFMVKEALRAREGVSSMTPFVAVAGLGDANETN